MLEISTVPLIIIVAGLVTSIVMIDGFLFLQNFSMAKQVRYETGLKGLHDQLEQSLIIDVAGKLPRGGHIAS